jgi:cytochrome c oxidase cbb3-type subunit 3
MNRWLLLAAAALMLPGCEREMRRFDTPPQPTDIAQTSGIHAGPPAASAPVSLKLQRPIGLEDNAYAVSQGKRLFRWYNCNGCHANGGGGMGVPLIDGAWRYGGETAQIVATILQGRPNGMPSFAGRMPQEQAWQLAAYVRSMSGQLHTDVAPSRSDALSSGEPESRRERAASQPESNQQR